MHANNNISIYSNEFHSRVQISLVLIEISLKVQSNGYTFSKSVSIDLFNLPPLPNEWNPEESYMGHAIQLLHPQWKEFQTAG